MLKGLAITPPVIGRISIGRVIERNGKRLPEKDDQFTLTSQVQNRDGWALHPMDEALRESSGGKLRSIPVRLLFDDPGLNFRAWYTVFDRETGRPACVGDGEACRRAGNGGVVALPCPGPDGCEFGQAGGCKPYGRLNVGVSLGAEDEDDLGSFIFRTASYNSIRTLSARLHYYRAVCGGHLASLPLELKLRGKSTTQSYRTPIYYVDLVSRGKLELAIQQARETHEQRQAVGFDQQALDLAARDALANGAFEDVSEDASEVVESLDMPGLSDEIPGEALPDASHADHSHAAKEKGTLREKLEHKARGTP